MEHADQVIREGILLNLPASHWEQYITGGDLDEAKLLKAGYDGPGQVEWIHAEMVERGWLEKDAKIKGAPKKEEKEAPKGKGKKG